jgi:hypothetical protein
MARRAARKDIGQSEPQTVVVLIEFSASARVLNARLPTTVFAVVAGFSVTTVQCFDDESRTTQY